MDTSAEEGTRPKSKEGARTIGKVRDEMRRQGLAGREVRDRGRCRGPGVERSWLRSPGP